MTSINEQLDRARQALEEVKYSEKSLLSLEKEKNQLEIKKEEAYLQLLKENKDVDQLTGLSFKSFIAKVFNNRSEKIEKEELEAIEAKRVYDALAYELEILEEDMAKHRRVLMNKDQYLRTYQQAFEQKKQFVMSSSTAQWSEIEKIEQEKNDLDLELKELSEAILAGKQVISTTTLAIKDLKSAKSLGVWDTLGGGMLVTMAKREHMSSAQSQINCINNDLKKFNKELADLNMSLDNEVDLSTYMGFADYFFDNFFMDLMVQDKIEKAMTNVEELYRKLETIHHHLIIQAKLKKTQRDDLDKQMNKLIIGE